MFFFCTAVISFHLRAQSGPGDSLVVAASAMMARYFPGLTFQQYETITGRNGALWGISCTSSLRGDLPAGCYIYQIKTMKELPLSGKLIVS